MILNNDIGIKHSLSLSRKKYVDINFEIFFKIFFKLK